MIEQIHADVVAGDPATLRSGADELLRASREVDDASRAVVDGMTGVSWPSGLATVVFTARARTTFVDTSLAGWRLFRCGSLLEQAAEAYRSHCDSAETLMRAWRALDPVQRDHPLTRFSYLLAMTGVREGWSAWLSGALDSLTGDDGLGAQQDWMEDGAGKSFANHVANGTNLGPRIPNSVLNSGEHWVQQGLAQDPRTGDLLMSSHRHEDPSDFGSNKLSGLTLIDGGTGAEQKSVTLTSPGGLTEPNHSGGVAVQGDDVYVVSTEGDGPYVYRYSLAEIRESRDGSAVRAVARTRIPVPPGQSDGPSSYIATGGGDLWLGQFRDDEPGALHQVSPDLMRSWEDGSSSTLPPAIDTPPGVNGVHVTPDSFTFARNNGRHEPSELITQNRFTGQQQGDPLTQGNLIEEITGSGGGAVTTTNESGAYKYDPTDPTSDDPDALWAQTHMTDVPAASLGGDVEVDTQTLRGASGEFARAEDLLAGVSTAVGGVSVSASSLGRVANADAFASAVVDEVVRAGEEASRAERASAVIFSGLRDTAAGYDLTDLEVADGLSVITGLLGG